MVHNPILPEFWLTIKIPLIPQICFNLLKVLHLTRKVFKSDGAVSVVRSTIVVFEVLKTPLGYHRRKTVHSTLRVS